MAFRADHIGSLLRPKKLREAFRAHAGDGSASRVRRGRRTRRSSRSSALQEDCGLPVVTDGEFRRSSYWGRSSSASRASPIKPAVLQVPRRAGPRGRVHRAVRERQGTARPPIAVDELSFLRRLRSVGQDHACRRPRRCTSTAARDCRPSAYDDPAAFFADSARVYRAEIAELAEAGCRYVQLDEVAVAMLCDPAVREKVKRPGRSRPAGRSLHRRHQRGGRRQPQDMTVGVHMCRGNFKGMYLSEGGYESVAEKFFGRSRRRPFPARVRHAARGRLRAASPLPKVEGRGARAGELEDAQPGKNRRAAPARGRGGEVCRCRRASPSARSAASP